MRPLSELPTSPMPRRTWRAALATYAHPATLALLLLGFAAGLPYMLVFSTLSVWLREAGVTHQTIGYASLIGLAYAFKWVWAPMLDQWRLPLLGRLDVPTLVVAGAEDAMLPPSEQKALAGQIAGGAYRAIDGSGHFPMLEQPEAFRAAIARFVGL